MIVFRISFIGIFVIIVIGLAICDVIVFAMLVGVVVPIISRRRTTAGCGVAVMIIQRRESRLDALLIAQPRISRPGLCDSFLLILLIAHQDILGNRLHQQRYGFIKVQTSLLRGFSLLAGTIGWNRR